MTDHARNPDFGLDWLAADGEDADVVLSTRVRIARNLQGHAYTRRLPPDEQAVLNPQDILSILVLPVSIILLAGAIWLLELGSEHAEPDPKAKSEPPHE